MKKSKIIILILFIILSCRTDKKESLLGNTENGILEVNPKIDSNKVKLESNKNKNTNEKDSTTENYDVYLKGGFSVIYSTNNDEQYLIYKKGEKTIDTISSGSVDLLIKNIGYVVADFDDSFVFVQSYGSGNPHMVQIYEKETAKNLIEENSAFIDIDSSKEVLLYSKNDVPKPIDKMTLFDTKKRKKVDYKFPKEVFGEAEILNRIKLIKVTNKDFIIGFDFNDYNQQKTKKYIR
ncbi:hypothetical protein HNP99_003126 [Flavobacterium sp. 28A]|uniref:hypothetical protein n=1 Tax=Flavobacterium sp. 28A TaxID=2735895 RepID=UPI00156E03A4|nr:hypothetical protein [Flavobacterium sp. 28A]NRT16754.1 hypothetical protein [Flavobacterium sp. 28A]